jgi:poly-gamma-glutamate capsule biosynthesis protein CapA/YwtB (metallophosphatase superfamily)
VTTTTVKPDRPVVLAFGGDVHFEGVLRNLLAADPATVLESIAPVLASADIAMVNLETAITERGVPQPKQYTFRAPASAFTALAAGGVDVTTMANNHGLDFGPVGLNDSLDAIRVTRFPVVGIGADAAHAYAPFRRTVHGERIAIIGATQVIDDALIPTWTASAAHGGLASAKDVDRLVAEVRKARVDSDTVVVFLHWGQEGMTCPTPTQTALAHRLVDAGADIIVGSHAHRLLGAGHLGTAFVDYGLGNFAFYAQGGPAADTGVLFVTVTGRHIDGYEWRPAVINGGVPRPLSGTAADAARAQWQSRRSCTDLAP